MHLLYDENGNPIPHGAHDEHHHHHDHHHEGEDCGHACNACGSEEKCKDENLALLTYMLQHNEHHAAELDEMADKLEKAGMADAAKQIRGSIRFPERQYAPVPCTDACKRAFERS